MIDAVRDYLPPTLQLAHLKTIDRRPPELDDRSLIIALHETGWDGLITNNNKMLDVSAEVAAIVKTKLTVIAIEGLGHDPVPSVRSCSSCPASPSGSDPSKPTSFGLPTDSGHPPTPGTTSWRQPPDAIEIPTSFGARSVSPTKK